MSWTRAGDLGRRLRAVREALGLTQQAFAELVGVVDQSVSDYETGRSQPSKSRLERLARALQIPVAVFREGGPDPTEALERARMPQEARTPGEPGSVRGPGRRKEDVELRAAGLRKDAARLDRLVTLLRVYRDSDRPASPEVIAEWLEIAGEHATPPAQTDSSPDRP